jgi:serine phosphatase RsbU (regulator of sigma subunit)/anti-sigma regulatory factor (Ser/Thr protein kinase)
VEPQTVGPEGAVRHGVDPSRVEAVRVDPAAPDDDAWADALPGLNAADTDFAAERISALAAAVARCGDRAGSAESAARQITAAIRNAFPGPDGESAIVLVRIFQTSAWERLTPQLRSYALARMAPGAEPTGTRCLALLATLGDRPSWCDRHASRDHQALPMAGTEVIRRVPLALTVLDHLVGSQAQQRPSGEDGRPSRVAVHLVSEVAGSPLVPAQSLVDSHRVTAALGLGGILPGGEVFTAVLMTRSPVSASAARRFSAVAEAMRAALAPFAHLPLFDPAPPVGRVVPRGADGAPGSGLSSSGSWPTAGATTQNNAILPPADDAAGWSVRPRPSIEAALREQRERLAQESRIVETLYSVGQSLARQLDLRKLVQQAIEAATSVVNARFGVFFYTAAAQDGTAAQTTRFALAGLPPEGFESFGLPQGTALFGPTPPDRATVRCADVTRDPRFGGSPPYHGFPPGHPMVRSFMSVPVIAANGEVLGGFYFGHPDPGIFSERDEQLAQGIAAQAASAMENARLYRHERTTAMRLQHSLLPMAPPRLGDLDIASAYLPGEQGARVGGDWFDVIALSADRVALVIGDVMGRGIGAAAVMGQLRAAIQAYAVMDLPPSQVMDQLNHLVCQLPQEQIATCVYAVYDPSEGTVRWANAGHLPPALVAPDGSVTLLEADLGMPLGVEGAVFADDAKPMPNGARLLLYTDGLVECRDQSLQDRLGRLRAVLTQLCSPAAPVGVSPGCARLAEALLTGAEHDDVAVLFVAAHPAVGRKASVQLAATLEAARAARRFSVSTLEKWNAAHLTDTVCSIVSELVTNAVEHAGTPMELRLRSRPGALMVEVADADGRLARATPTSSGDERHRGLVIVGTLSARWGVRPTANGKVVWAQIADDSPEGGEPGAEHGAGQGAGASRNGARQRSVDQAFIDQASPAQIEAMFEDEEDDEAVPNGVPRLPNPANGTANPAVTAGTG